MTSGRKHWEILSCKLWDCTYILTMGRKRLQCKKVQEIGNREIVSTRTHPLVNSWVNLGNIWGERKIYKGSCQIMNTEQGPWSDFGVGKSCVWRGPSTEKIRDLSNSGGYFSKYLWCVLHYKYHCRRGDHYGIQMRKRVSGNELSTPRMNRTIWEIAFN